MAKFKVTLYLKEFFEVEVEAKDENEAKELALTDVLYAENKDKYFAGLGSFEFDEIEKL